MIVVDASVAVKWLIPERGEAAAMELLVQPLPLIAPSLIRVEVTAALLRAFREDRFTQEEARDAINRWGRILEDGIVQLISDHELHSSAVDIGFKSRHAFQDCLYLAAAHAMKAKLITADRPLFERGARIIAGMTFLDGV